MSNAVRDMCEASIRRHVRGGMLSVVLLAVGVGGWAGFSDISGAIIAPAVVVVSSHEKKVQHGTGGTIAHLFVREGDRVTAGDVLIHLDDTIARANLAIVTKALTALTARKARLEAERDDKTSVEFPALAIASSDPDAAQVLEGESKLFLLRRKARLGQKAQLKERISQLEQEIAGYGLRETAKAKEMHLINRELSGSRELWAKGLLPISKLTALEREATRLEGERGQLLTYVSETRGKISETELQIVQIDRDLGTEVGKDLRETEARIAELSERQIEQEDQLRHLDIRAPETGTILQLSVHTIGGVVAAGETLMLVVPDETTLSVDAKVSPTDIDKVNIGQRVALRFTAFDQRTTPEVEARIETIGADVQADAQKSIPYYAVRLALGADELRKTKHLKLVPGMPAEAFIDTGSRTVVSYLLKPLEDQFHRALRDD